MKKRGRGRPKIAEDSKLKTYRVSQALYEEFCEFCRSRKLTPSEVIRSLMRDYYLKELISELKTLKEMN